MMNVTVNGVSFDLATRADVNEHCIVKTLTLPGYPWGAVLDGKRRDTLYRAAGYDVNKIDFAVPVDWQRSPNVMERLTNLDRPAWTYEDGSMCGSPIWDSEMYARLRDRIVAELRGYAG
jgi:hypothetical protein